MPILRISVVTFALLFHTGCGTITPDNDQVIDIVYDPCDGVEIRAAEDTTASELVAIDRAIAIWQNVSVVDLSSLAPPSPPSSSLQTLDIRFEDAALLFRGVYEDDVGDVIVNRRLSDPEQLAITVAHEVGHALGLPHIDSRVSVMNSGNITVLPQESDVQALAALWGPCVQIDKPSAQ